MIKLRKHIHFNIIPSLINNSPNLSDGAKLLFGDIFTFQIQGKDVYMTNSKLGKRYGVSAKTVSRKISELRHNHLITTCMNTKEMHDGNIVTYRTIKISSYIRHKLLKISKSNKISSNNRSNYYNNNEHNKNFLHLLFLKLFK